MRMMCYIFERRFEYLIGELVADAFARGRMVAHVLEYADEALAGLVDELDLADELLEQRLLEALLLERPEAVALGARARERVRPRLLLLLHSAHNQSIGHYCI